jgi:hypothetical protein
MRSETERNSQGCNTMSEIRDGNIIGKRTDSSRLIVNVVIRFTFRFGIAQYEVDVIS